MTPKESRRSSGTSSLGAPVLDGTTLDAAGASPGDDVLFRMFDANGLLRAAAPAALALTWSMIALQGGAPEETGAGESPNVESRADGFSAAQPT